MFCEPYRQALMDAAAAGQPLTSALARHLAGCNACSSAFVEERAMYATIDRSLYAAANVAVPDCVLPRIQAAISQSEPKGRDLQWRMVLAPMTVCMCALSLVLLFREAARKELSKALPGRTPTNSQSLSAEQKLLTAPMNSGQLLQGNRKSRNVHRESLRPTEARVQIDPTSQIAMNRLILVSRSAPDIVRSLSKNSDSVSMEIKPIEVASINLEPLSEELDMTNVDVKNRTEPNP